MLSLITKLVEILERGWRESRHPRRRLARAIALLYGALVTCHDSYLQYRSDRTDESLRLWGVALDSLITSLSTVTGTVDIFEPKLARSLHNYVRSESRIAAACTRPGALAELALGELGYLLKEEPSTAYLDEEFGSAVEHLGAFIRTNFKIEEIFSELGTNAKTDDSAGHS